MPASERKPVEVVPYDAGWPAAFNVASGALSNIVGAAASAIHHVGSTSVPGLCAKPVIDILVETPDLGMLDLVTPQLQAEGYEAKGEYGIPGRRYFDRPPGRALRIHVHGFRLGSLQIERHLLFRDYLRANTESAHEYGTLKRRLAVEHAGDRGAYQRGKAAFIEQIHEYAKQCVRDRE